MKKLLRINFFILLAMIALIVIGTCFVYSANSIRESVRLQSLYVQHARLGAFGLLIGLGLALFDYRKLLNFSWIFYGGSCALLIAVLLIGETRMGAQRWVFGIQPSELAKVSVIMLLSQILGREDARRDWFEFLLACIITLLPVALILKQPDLGTSIVFVPILFTILFVGGIAPRLLTLSLVCATLAVTIVLGSLIIQDKHPESRFAPAARAATSFLSNYQKGRLNDFLYPDRDPLNRGWNRRQSQIAVGSGGLHGKGFLKGDQNILGYLPQQVSANDFIFSVLAEEAGFVGAFWVLILYALLICSIMTTAALCDDCTGRLLCSGVCALVFSHVFINIGMTIGALPVTGLPLPFLSYGRTFMLAILFALGLVQSVSTHRAKN